MKHKRALLMLGLAMLLGLAAVLLASRWLLNQSPGAAGRIVVAAVDASPGQRLAPDMVKLADWPVESLPSGALREVRKLEGRVLRHAVQRGEPLSEGKLAPAGASGGLSALISEGKRAITVRVNDVVGVAGFALPGNFVDVLVYTQLDSEGHEGQRAISKIVLERILVLAVAQEVGRDDTKPRVVNAVTLEVTPVQAEQLDLARSVGTLSLALRNQVDPHPGITDGATKVSLLGMPDVHAVPAAVSSAPPAPAPAQSRPRVAQAAAKPAPRQCIGVINGVHSGQECF
ncbi:Flp pilus assembly protein CpaB [Pseudoduganella ginsengisoli]|uniref:Flp pilus assembly protein CpaB n=1 Tax=Pseudoduganella ginsengisoli TaxID=1462440 RepID=A0A6L6Q0X5_9BURK|nr:Flp pilus assembly protein CpaB [Pseudoduganella ginsengisoli]MTW03477.1 Flp pilus assembly protein CpaB [Pseudoduganella ginsengisoli]